MWERSVCFLHVWWGGKYPCWESKGNGNWASTELIYLLALLHLHNKCQSLIQFEDAILTPAWFHQSVSTGWSQTGSHKCSHNGTNTPGWSSEGSET